MTTPETRVLQFDCYDDAETAFDSAVTLGFDVDWQSPGEMRISRDGKQDGESNEIHTITVYLQPVTA